MYNGLVQNTNLIAMSFVDPAGGTTSLDSNYQPVYTPAIKIETNGNFVDLSPTEIAAREQIQDDSRYKAVLEDTELNRTIKASWFVTIDGEEYSITGRPRRPQFADGWITVYLKKES